MFGARTRWQAETFVCSLRGHCAPAAEVAELSSADAGLGVDLPDGRRMARCVRCDAWVAGDRPADPSRTSLPPLDELELPRRDKALRQALLLRLIAIDRGIHSVLFGLVAAALLTLQYKLGPLQRWAADLRSNLSSTLNQTGRNPSRDFLLHVLDRILKINRHGFGVLIITAVIYCVLEGSEAVGLWLEKRWAEYLTAIATAGFLPFEIHELMDRTTVLRIVALVINVAVLIYLVWAKHLCGIGGPPDDGRDHVDREAVFGPPAFVPAGRE